MQPVSSFIPTMIQVCSHYAAPYSSTSDTAAGLASEGFMNTYGKCNQSLSNLINGPDNTSVPIHNYGCPNVNLHGLCNSHQCGVHSHFPLPAPGFPPFVCSLLATRPRQCSYWWSMCKSEYYPNSSNFAAIWAGFWLSISLFQGAGASLFVASLLGFYLLIVQLFESIGFPCFLPVGDLATLWTRRHAK